MNKVFVGSLLAMVILAAAGGGYWYGSVRPRQPAAGAAAPGGAANPAAKSGPAQGSTPAAMPVEVTKVGAAMLPQAITAVGSLRSDESVTLRPEVAGRITAILFQEGQRVKKGATLVRLDAAINLADVQQVRANLALAQSKYERAVDLSGRNFISSQARDEAKNNFEVALAALALAEAKLAKTELTAPFSGIIGLRVVSEGDYVKEGADLVNLEAIDPIKVDFRVPETFLKDVQVGQSVVVALDALPGKTYDGKIIALNPLVDAGGRALVIRAQVRNQDTALRPGMFARVTLITRSEKESLVLPEEALVPLGTEQFVFRVVDGKAVRTTVKTGQRRDSKVEILSGVSKDDVIVSAGQIRLRDGVEVRVAESDASAKAKAAKAAPVQPPPSAPRS